MYSSFAVIRGSSATAEIPAGISGGSFSMGNIILLIPARLSGNCSRREKRAYSFCGFAARLVFSAV